MRHESLARPNIVIGTVLQSHCKQISTRQWYHHSVHSCLDCILFTKKHKGIVIGTVRDDDVKTRLRCFILYLVDGLIVHRVFGWWAMVVFSLFLFYSCTYECEEVFLLALELDFCRSHVALQIHITYGFQTHTVWSMHQNLVRGGVGHQFHAL